MSRDEAVSLMGAVLPTLKRWSAVHANEMRYGKEARERYGDGAVDAANDRLMDMDDTRWESREALEAAIIDELKRAFAQGDPEGPCARKLAAMHARWIEMSWGEGAYSPEAHLALVRSYLADHRFVDYYDSRAGKGATAFLAKAVEAWHTRD